jgi:DNA polymerase
MTKLFLDIETNSPEPLADCGVYKYATHPDFKILLLAYAIDGAPVEILDLSEDDPIPNDLYRLMIDKNVLKIAHNATFERICLRRHLGLNVPNWHCTMAQCLRTGLPASLDQAAKVLKLKSKKMAEGKDLIKLFCMPKKTSMLGESPRVRRHEAPDKWELFKEYCKRDVEVEREIYTALRWYRPTYTECELYEVDQAVNDRGIKIDRQLVDNAVKIEAICSSRQHLKASAITGLDNPNSVPQLKAWLEERLGIEVPSLTKSDIAEILEMTDDPVVHEALNMRRKSGKTSISKYGAMLAVADNEDDRLRGLFQYYGSRTGRWTGRLVQLHNLPRNTLDDLDFARQAVRENDMELLDLCFDNVPAVLSQLIRTALVPKKGHTFVVCDFSAIEARVIAWLAGEQWAIDVFKGHGKIYEATAAQMFRCDVDEITRDDPRRDKGKIAVLALGFGGGIAALEAMGGKRMGLEREEMEALVKQWRQTNPNIVSLWREVEDAARQTLLSKAPINVRDKLMITTRNVSNDLIIQLPSGRQLIYREMQTGLNRFGKPSLVYKGVNQTSRKWESIETYGGKLVENIVQAIARDCLAEALITIEKNCLDPVLHVHDEIVCEVPREDAQSALERILAHFKRTPSWARGLPLKGSGFITEYYKKD